MLEREGDVAAVICETVRCSPSVPPPDFWKRIRAACDRHGALLILDEIPIGLGRTGTFFAFEAFGIVPDLVVLGKALGGGIMPLGAVIASERLNCLAESSIGHFTHEKNPVSCAAGLATLEVIESENLVQRARQMGEYAWAKLQALSTTHPLAKGARGVGLLLGLELNGLPEAGLSANSAASQTMYECLKRGLNFKVSRGNILTLTPPLNITTSEMERAIEVISQSLTSVEEHARDYASRIDPAG
jgi:4-aminobutyrate aminotransferase